MWSFSLASSLHDPLKPYIHNQYSMLNSQSLYKYDFTEETNLFVLSPNKKQIHLRTCHPTLPYDKMLLCCLKARIRYNKVKSRQKNPRLNYPLL